MSRAARSVQLALEKQADQVGRTQGEYLALQAAQTGLGEQAQRLAAIIEGSGSASAAAGGIAAAGFASASAAAEASVGKQRALNAELVKSILQVNAAYEARRAAIVAQGESGAITTDKLKGDLKGLGNARDDAVAQLKAAAAQERAENQLAATAAADAEKRSAAAQKIIDAQNGLTASYRQELAALEELQAKGNLSPAQFKQASTDLLAKQPVSQKSADNEAAAKREAAAAQTLIDTLNGVGSTYRKNLAILQDTFRAGKISAAEFQSALAKLNDQRPDVQRYKQQQAEIEATARVDVETAEKRKAAAQSLLDKLAGVPIAYQKQLQALQDSLKAGDITPKQFQTGVLQATAQRPDVQKYKAEQEALALATLNAARAEETAAKAAAARGLALALAGNVTATVTAQSQAYLSALVAQAAAENQAVAAQARQAEVTQAIAAASARAADAQRAAYATKTAFIGAVNEETAALFRTKDAQRQLDAERAGVSPQQAAQIARVAGNREFIASIYRAIDAEREFAAEFGKTAAEIFKQDAAERGLSNTTASAIARFEALAAVNQKTRDTSAANKSNEQYLAGLQREADISGKARSEIVALELAQRGLTEQGAPLLAKFREIDAQTGQLGKNVFATKNQLLTLKYTLSDIVASAASGISPLTILLQQGGQVAQVEGGIGGIFKTVVSLITPFRVAVAGGTAAVSALVYALYEGSRQSKAFADSIVLTGGYAGVTEGQFNALAKGVAASGQVTIGVAREFGQALIATGQVGPRVLESATAAAAKYGEATGKNAKEVASDYAAMGADVAKWAADHNRQLNFVTGAQYDQIKSLQDTGHAAEAQAIVYDALNKRFSSLDQNLGTLEKTLRLVKGGWSAFWDSAFDIGRAETIDDKIKNAEAAVERLRNVGTERLSQTQLDPQRRAQIAATKPQEIVAGEENVTELKRLKIAQESAVLRTAENAATTQRVIDGKALVKQYQDEAKGVTAYQTELKKLQSQFDDAKSIGNPYSAEAQAEALKGLKKKFTDTSAQGEADAERKALLDQDLKFTKSSLEQKTDLLKFNQQVLSAIYAGSNISLKDYYDERRKLTEDGVQEELNALIDQQARLEVELEKGAFKDPHEKTQVQTQLNESIAQYAKVQREAGQAATLSSLEEAQAFKALNDRVVEYRANLLQLQGDELGAATLRAKTVIQNAKDLAKGSGGLISDTDVALQARAIEQANAFAEVQRRVAVVTGEAGRAEEVFLQEAAKRGAGLEEQETGVYQLRALALRQLAELTEKSRALADASSDPRIKQFADELAISYEKAAQAISPALNRIRDATLQVASDISSGLASSLSNFGDLQNARAQQAAQDTANQRNAYTKQIDDLRSSLKNISDVKQRAAVQDRIKDLEAKRAAVQDQNTFLKTLERDVLGPALKKVYNVGIKLFVEQPLEAFLKAQVAKALANVSTPGLIVDTKGTGADAVGHGFSQAKDSAAADLPDGTVKAAADELTASITTQTTAVTDSTAALRLFTDGLGRATSSAAGAPTGATTGSITEAGGAINAPVDPTVEANRKIATAGDSSAQLGDSLVATKAATQDFNDVLPKAGALLGQLGGDAGVASQALALLPGIIKFIEAAAGSGSGGSGFDTILKLFGAGSSGGSNTTDYRGTTLPDSLRGGAATGTNMLERDLLTIVHQGEAVVPKAYNPAAPGGAMWFTDQLSRSRPTLNVNVRQPPVVQQAQSRGTGGETGGNVFITNNAPAEVKSAQRDNNGDWQILIDKVSDQVHSRVASDVGSGSGRVSSAMRKRGVNLDGNLPRRA